MTTVISTINGISVHRRLRHSGYVSDIDQLMVEKFIPMVVNKETVLLYDRSPIGLISFEVKAHSLSCLDVCAVTDFWDILFNNVDGEFYKYVHDVLCHLVNNTDLNRATATCTCHGRFIVATQGVKIKPKYSFPEDDFTELNLDNPADLETLYMAIRRQTSAFIYDKGKHPWVCWDGIAEAVVHILGLPYSSHSEKEPYDVDFWVAVAGKSFNVFKEETKRNSFNRAKDIIKTLEQLDTVIKD